MKSTATMQKQPLLIRIVRARAFYLILALIFITFGLWFNPSQITAMWSTDRMAKGFWDNFGIVSAVAGGFALILYLLRLVWTQYKQGPTASANLVEVGMQLVKWLRAQHVFFGWLTFGLAMLHAVYFLFFPRGTALNIYTGLIATAVMFFLVGLGIMYQYKTISATRSARKWHMYIGLAFAVAVTLHILL